MMNKLNVTNLHKSFKNQIVLDGVSFAAKKGEVIALLGSSGSGKSTLLRCINLLTIPDNGSVQIDENHFQFGKAEKPVPSKEIIHLRKKIGIVFQQFNLWSHMSIIANLIEAPIHVLKMKKDEVIGKAEKLLNDVGLLHKKDQYPAQLSGGQQQRAAIARALMMSPEIMLFDEPTSALDPETVKEVLNVMQALAMQGMTMVVATHELGFAKKVASQTIFLHEGKILEHGDTEVLFNSPKSVRFKQFLEAMQN